MEEHKASLPDFDSRAGIYQTYLQINDQERTEQETLEALQTLQDSLQKIEPQSDWEDALVSKMLVWSEQFECNLLHTVNEDDMAGTDLKCKT
eukprot:TRINITY_DN4052_c0_g1_i1.p1 TRINITY_DN4052_c0_g1~~TRINITY_DN4052_c0_g1_i1.p1  ORF type:complete len:92 (+),score=18.93 TRINITY_DN4052_c0_g1_i1:124-399(+)